MNSYRIPVRSGFLYLKKWSMLLALLVGYGLTTQAQQIDSIDYSIRINQYQFDPLERMPDIPDNLRYDQDTFQGDLPVIIQFYQKLGRAEMKMLKDRYNLKLDRYISGNAYIETVDDKIIAQLRKSEILRWAGPYEPVFKISPGIGKMDFKTAERKNLRGLLLVAILVPNSDSDNFEKFLSGAGASKIRQVGTDIEKRYEFVWPLNRPLSELAIRPEVFRIFEVPEINDDNNSTAGTIQSGTSGTTPIWNNNLHGEGEIIHVLDTELDTTHCFFSDIPNVPGINHRKVVGFRGPDTGSGHGTFVAGNAAGDDFNNPGTAFDRGMAWAARITFSLRDASDFLSDLNAAKSEGAFIHTNSWHSEPSTWYDQVSFDGDEFTFYNEDHLILGSSGNVGERLGPPGTAKNAICVSASQSDNNEMNFGDGNSGPTPDNRRKPDLFAVGCNINSATMGTNCTTGPRSACATSYATPVTAGAAAMIRQYYREGFYPTGASFPSHGFTPTGALIKATLLNTTINMTGIAGYPGNMEGWGLILLDNALFFQGDALNSRVWDVRHANGLMTSENHDYELIVSSNAQNLKIAMVYSDAPGTVDSDTDVLTNDLDLTVIAPDGTTTFLGNVFFNGFSTTGGSDDDLNNVEMILINNPQAGTWTIRVSAEEVNVGNPSQGYALVATGDFPDPPLPSGDQNTLVVKLRENGGAGPSQSTITTTMISVIDYVDEVSYSQTTINPVYFPAGDASIELDHSYSHYFIPDQNPLIEMAEEVVSKMITLDPDVFDRGNADPSDDIDRIVFVTNQSSSTQEWATTGQWPYPLPTGLPEPLSVSVNSVNHSPALFQHNICNQLGLWNLHAHPGVVFSQRHVDMWDLMARPADVSGNYITTGLMVWSKELVDWISDHGSDITYIPRPTAGNFTNQTLGLNHITDVSINRKAIVVGLTEGAATLANEDVFFYIEARTNGEENVDETLPESGVLVYYVNENIPQGQGPVQIIDTDLADTDPALALNNAALAAGQSTSNVNGTGLDVSVASGTSGNDYNVTINFDPPETDNDVRITVGNPAYTSPDIWVDNQADGYDDPASASDKGNQPITEEDNRIYVRINNPGPGDAFNFDVFVKVSEPYHTVGGDPDFNVFVNKKHFTLLEAGDTETFSVTWRPEDDGNPHSCIEVNIPNVFNDVNANNNRAQQNTQEIASTSASPYTPVEYYFGFTNPRNYQSLFYFRPDGIPADWTSSLSQRSARLNPGERVDVALSLQAPDDAPVCTDVPIDITSWEAVGNTLVPVGGGIVQVNLRERTNFSIQVTDTCNYKYRKGKDNVYLTHYDYHSNEANANKQKDDYVDCGLITQGCTNPIRPFEEIIIRYESPDGYPIYKKVTTDANGCFSDFYDVAEGGLWEVSAIYPGDTCSGPANAGPWEVNIPQTELTDIDGDGLPDPEEPQNGDGENPCLLIPDCDGDGIIDGEEDPDCVLNPDCNNNGKPDGEDRRKKCLERFDFSLHVGSAHPLGTLNNTTDANVHTHLGIHYLFGNHMMNQADLILGFQQFTREPDQVTVHPFWFNASLGYTRNFALGTNILGYVRAGAGYYRNEAAVNDIGMNVGAGLAFPVLPALKIIFGVDYHRLLQESSDQFLTLHLGIQF